jgi:hypothetical protein
MAARLAQNLLRSDPLYSAARNRSQGISGHAFQPVAPVNINQGYVNR